MKNFSSNLNMCDSLPKSGGIFFVILNVVKDLNMHEILRVATYDNFVVNIFL
ncbi:MAG: hypothetical protein IH595_01700 [Bacteroidales bacterium]|nr:hypothetical protein [Bacteroidales bacterium]